MIKNIDMKKVFKFIFLSTVIIIAFNYVVSGMEKRDKEIEEHKKTKCIQNELFYKEKKEFIKQNKKCVVIDNEPYIYDNGNLVRAY